MAGRANFASSAKDLVADLGFDGVDIDWEYPADSTQADNMVSTLQQLRLSLDTYSAAEARNYHFLISVACPAEPSNYQNLHISAMDKYLGFWNPMAYDYSGTVISEICFRPALSKALMRAPLPRLWWIILPTRHL